MSTKNATENVATKAAENILESFGPARQYALPAGPAPSREWLAAQRLEKAREIVTDWQAIRQSVKQDGLTDKAIDSLAAFAVVPPPKEGSKKVTGGAARAALAAATAGVELTLLGRFGTAARAASAAILGEVG